MRAAKRGLLLHVATIGPRGPADHLAIAAPMERCLTTGKRQFTDPLAAMRVASSWQTDQDLSTYVPYLCADCRTWHLTGNYSLAAMADMARRRRRRGRRRTAKVS
jgi:hypothetical protein